MNKSRLITFALPGLLLFGACSATPSLSPSLSPSAPSVALPTALPAKATATPQSSPTQQSADATATPQAQLTPAPGSLPDAFERNARLGRGVNLGNALEAPKEGEWGITLEENDFQLIAGAGFNHVRVPIRWSAHAGEAAPYTIDAAFFQRIDWVVQQAISRKLAVVLNMHHYDDAVLKPAEHEARLLALWRQIAAHYRNASPDVYLEVFNEPHDISDTTWNELLAQAIATIRAVDPKRTLIVGPVDWYSYRRLNDLQLPDEDRNLIVSFHYYSPFEFTHQGAEWVNGSDKWLGRAWDGTTAQRDDIEFELNVAATWGKSNNRPIYLGEFGAYSRADMASRARWTAYVARQAEARQMSWAYWEFRAGFGVYDGKAKRWNDPLRKALLPAG